MRLDECRRRPRLIADESAYRRANLFIRNLRQYYGRLTDQQIKTLRGQALSGDLEGAWSGLKRLSRGKKVIT